MISIIIPTYNEIENIGKLIKKIFEVARKNRLKIEIIVVDDNSIDGTAKIVRKLVKKYNVKLLERPQKMGLTNAILDGLKIAKGSIIGTLDADFSHPPEKIPELVKVIKDNDIAVGSKYVKGGKIIGVSIFRKITSKGAILIAKLFFDIKIKDPMSGFFFCKRKIIEKTKIEAKGFKILLNILVRNRNKKVKEVPILFIERRKGKSKFEFLEIINFLITVFRLIDK